MMNSEKSMIFSSSKVMDTVDSLYNEVEEHVHVLVRRSNMSFQHLGFLLQLRKMESRFLEVSNHKSSRLTFQEFV